MTCYFIDDFYTYPPGTAGSLIRELGTETPPVYINLDLHGDIKLAGRALELFEPFTDVPMPHKPKCYNPRASRSKTKKTFTCANRMRGNYF